MRVKVSISQSLETAEKESRSDKGTAGDDKEVETGA
jgi:hypothetical protein